MGRYSGSMVTAGGRSGGNHRWRKSRVRWDGPFSPQIILQAAACRRWPNALSMGPVWPDSIKRHAARIRAAHDRSPQFASCTSTSRKRARPHDRLDSALCDGITSAGRLDTAARLAQSCRGSCWVLDWRCETRHPGGTFPQSCPSASKGQARRDLAAFMIASPSAKFEPRPKASAARDVVGFFFFFFFNQNGDIWWRAVFEARMLYGHCRQAYKGQAQRSYPMKLR